MILVGIDPGVTGGLAFIEGKHLLGLHDMPVVTDADNKRRPSAPGIAALFHQYRPQTAVIEWVNAMPSVPGKDGKRRTMGAQSAFNFGRGFGVVEGTAQALGLEVQLVRPATWKARAGLRKQRKDYARTVALQLHPEADLHKKRDIGKADALLIAIFGAHVR